MDSKKGYKEFAEQQIIFKMNKAQNLLNQDLLEFANNGELTIIYSSISKVLETLKTINNGKG